MPSAFRRKPARPFSGVFTTLLLVLLAFGGCPCSLLAHIHSAPPPVAHVCCHDAGATSNQPPAPAPFSCYDGPCLQISGHDNPSDSLGPLVSSLDSPAQPLPNVGLSPWDWLGCAQSFFSTVTGTTGPPPGQRSRVLRL